MAQSPNVILLGGTALAASNFPDCTSGPLANNSICDTSLSKSLFSHPICPLTSPHIHKDI